MFRLYFLLSILWTFVNGKEGLDTAHKLAYKYAKEEGYTNLITMDADLSHDPSKIPMFINELNFILCN